MKGVPRKLPIFQFVIDVSTEPILLQRELHSIHWFVECIEEYSIPVFVFVFVVTSFNNNNQI